MRGRFLIDECLSGDLVAIAKVRGYDAHYTPHIGKGGWQDWNLIPFAIEHDYVFVTLNRKDFLKHYASLRVHPGLVILIAPAPNNKRAHQIHLFEKALITFASMNDDVANKVIEAHANGVVSIRNWNAGGYDIGHINNPRQG